MALKENRTDEAIEHLKKAASCPPLVWQVDGIQECLANAYLELGRLDEAAYEYEHLLGTNPAYPLAHYNLAVIYERKGEYQQSRAHYERFIQAWNAADADIPQVTRAKQHLAGLH